MIKSPSAYNLGFTNVKTKILHLTAKGMGKTGNYQNADMAAKTKLEANIEKHVR